MIYVCLWKVFHVWKIPDLHLSSNFKRICISWREISNHLIFANRNYLVWKLWRPSKVTATVWGNYEPNSLCDYYLSFYVQTRLLVKFKKMIFYFPLGLPPHPLRKIGKIQNRLRMVWTGRYWKKYICPHPLKFSNFFHDNRPDIRYPACRIAKKAGYAAGYPAGRISGATLNYVYGVNPLEFNPLILS